VKAVLLDRHGPPGVLRLQDVPEPRPGAGQVRVRVQTVGLNYAEVLSRKGLYGWAPRLPYVLGMEAYGHVDATGEGVDPARRGEAVLVGAQYGSNAEAVVVPSHQALSAFEAFTPEENAAFAVNYLTAWVSLVEMARLRPTDTVLVQAAAGGVGTAAVQIARRFGCTVYGTAGSDEKLNRLRELGVDEAVNYRRQDFERVLREASGRRGVDVVLETVGGEVFRKSERLLAPFGRIVCAGFASLRLERWNPVSWWRTWRDLPKADIRSLSVGSRGLLSSHVGYLLQQPDVLLRAWSDLRAFTLRHGIRPVVGASFALDAIAEAHALMESRRSHGKIVLQV